MIIKVTLFSEVRAGPVFYVTPKSFPRYPSLSTMTLYSPTKLNFTLPQNTSATSPNILPLLMLLTSPLLSLASTLPSSSKGLAATNYPFHTLFNTGTWQLPAQFPPSTHTTKALPKVSLTCLIFSTVWPCYIWIFKGKKKQTHIFNLF